jgi:hypothetical protein
LERLQACLFFPLPPTLPHFRGKDIPGQAKQLANLFCAQALRSHAGGQGNLLINQGGFPVRENAGRISIFNPAEKVWGKEQGPKENK